MMPLVDMPLAQLRTYEGRNPRRPILTLIGTRRLRK